jgi:hypothetical protein
MEPPVTQLPIHLPGQQTVVFTPQTVTAETLERNKRMKLISYFEIMVRSPEDRHLKYEDIQENYTWHADTRMWTEWQRAAGTLGRIVSVPPSTGDLFYLRILLKN